MNPTDNRIIENIIRFVLSTRKLKSMDLINFMRFFIQKWAMKDSNLRHPACKVGCLTSNPRGELVSSFYYYCVNYSNRFISSDQESKISNP